MALDFAGGGTLIDSSRIIAPTGYRTAESGQTEIYAHDEHGANQDTYETIYTVTTGKTLFVTDILGSEEFNSAITWDFATGAESSEVNFMIMKVLAAERVHESFQVPLRFASGTRLSWALSSAKIGQSVTFIGFEE
jgi:hypothetical protein